MFMFQTGTNRCSKLLPIFYMFNDAAHLVEYMLKSILKDNYKLIIGTCWHRANEREEVPSWDIEIIIAG